MAYKLKYTGEEIDSLLTQVSEYDGTNSASDSSARELYMDFTGQGLTDEQKAYNAETFTLLQTQGFSMYVAYGGMVAYPINSAGTYQPGDESIKLQYTMHNTDLSALMIGDFTLTQDGTVTVSPTTLEYKLTPHIEGNTIIVRNLKSNVIDITYNIETYEITEKGVNGEGPLPMLFYNNFGLLTFVYEGEWDFADNTKQYKQFTSDVFIVNGGLLQIKVALYEDGTFYEHRETINIPAQ